MGALATPLTTFADNGDSRTYTTAGHAYGKPKIVVNKRRVPSGNATTAEYSVAVTHGTADSAGVVLPQKVSMTATVRVPVGSADSEVANALVIFRDVVQSTEFGAAILSQNFLK